MVKREYVYIIVCEVIYVFIGAEYRAVVLKGMKNGRYKYNRK
jgi:hypothetical protein